MVLVLIVILPKILYDELKDSNIYIVNLVSMSAPGSIISPVEESKEGIVEREKSSPAKKEIPAVEVKEKVDSLPKLKEVKKIQSQPSMNDLTFPGKIEKDIPANLVTPRKMESQKEKSPSTTPLIAEKMPRVDNLPKKEFSEKSPSPSLGIEKTFPIGSSTQSLGAVSTGSISLDVSNFPFTFYLIKIQNKISENWIRPEGVMGRTIVVFDIMKDGKIKNAKLEKGSGNQAFDERALRAVLYSDPFLPLPDKFKDEYLRVHFGFEYKSERG